LRRARDASLVHQRHEGTQVTEFSSEWRLVISLRSVALLHGLHLLFSLSTHSPPVDFTF
jgi:hypothetical protein